MASNSTTILDEFGTADDWVELCNISNGPISLKGRYLTDNLALPNKWALPDTVMSANSFLIVWADDQPAQGRLHAPYKLDKAGEQIGVFDSTASGFVLIDSVTFGAQQTDVSFARQPNGTGSFAACTTPTPGWSNTPASAVEQMAATPQTTKLIGNYPNPFNPETVVSYWLSDIGKIDLRVYDILGREVRTLVEEAQYPGRHSVTFNASRLASGIYVCRLTAGGTASSIKMMRVN
jgi:hypothetical protein